MKTKILLASILGCSSILMGYAKENINNNSHIVADTTNYDGQFKATAGTDKITGERIVTYTLPPELLSDTEKYALYSISLIKDGKKDVEIVEKLPINMNTLTYIYTVPNYFKEGAELKGYITLCDKDGRPVRAFYTNLVTIPAIDEKVLISEPQEDGTVFTITYDDPSVTLNPSLSNTKQGDVVLDDGMEVIEHTWANPNQIKVKINEKAIHTIKVNVSDKQVKQYKLQVGPQQYPQNIMKNKQIVTVHNIKKSFWMSDNVYADIQPLIYEGLLESSILGLFSPTGELANIYKVLGGVHVSTQIIPTKDSDQRIQVKFDTEWTTHGTFTFVSAKFVFKQSTRFYEQKGILTLVIDNYDGHVIKSPMEIIDGVEIKAPITWFTPTPLALDEKSSPPKREKIDQSELQLKMVPTFNSGGYGNLGIDLSINPKYEIKEITTKWFDEDHNEYYSVLEPHASGANILLEPINPRKTQGLFKYAEMEIQLKDGRFFDLSFDWTNLSSPIRYNVR